MSSISASTSEDLDERPGRSVSQAGRDRARQVSNSMPDLGRPVVPILGSLNDDRTVAHDAVGKDTVVNAHGSVIERRQFPGGPGMGFAGSPCFPILGDVVQDQVRPVAVGQLHRGVAEDAWILLELEDDLEVGLLEWSPILVGMPLAEESDELGRPAIVETHGVAYHHASLEIMYYPFDPAIRNDRQIARRHPRQQSSQILEHVSEDGEVTRIEPRRGKRTSGYGLVGGEDSGCYWLDTDEDIFGTAGCTT
jgi:hypothetical protein